MEQTDPKIADEKDDDLEKKLEDSLLATGETAPTSPPEKGDNPDEKTGADVETEEKPKAPDAPTPAPVPAATTDTLYAGKYKSADELIAGVLASAKELSVPESLLKERIEQAKKDGKYDGLEAIYKSLSDEQRSRAEAKKAEAEKPAEWTVESFLKVPQNQRWYVDHLGQLLTEHPIVQKFIDKDVQFPKDQAEVDALKSIDPDLYIALVQARDEIKQAAQKELQAAIDRHKSLSPAKQAAEEHGRNLITEQIKKFELTFTPEQMKKLLEDVWNDPSSYERLDGFDVAKKTAVSDYFQTRVYPALVEQALLTARQQGRTEGIKDLKDMHGKTIDSISTTTIPGTSPSGKRTEPKPEQVVGESDDDLNRGISEGLTSLSR